jgi:hypothetical protein
MASGIFVAAPSGMRRGWRDLARRGFTRAARFGRRRWKWVAVPVALVVVALVALDYLLDEPLRRQMERRLNERLTGYTVSLRALDFHVVGGSLDLLDLVVAQQANPDPPVASIPRFTASIQWRELVRGHVVADFLVDRPVIHINRKQLATEAEDRVPVESRGWQEALEAIYPFRINSFRVAQGDLMYVEESGRPLHIRRVTFRAENIRNIRRRDHTYPSGIWLEGIVFDTGRLVIDGRADFLAEPHLGLRANVALEQVALDYVKPMAARYNLVINQGTMSANGEVEYAPWFKMLHLREVKLEGLHADYVHTPQTAATEQVVRKEVGKAAERAANAPAMLLRVDRAFATGANVGYVSKATTPPYRVFISQAELALENLSNHFTEGTAVAVLNGKFQGSGATVARATFRPETSGPDFDIDVRIDETQLRSMNELLRAYGKFDVTGGWFSFYTQLRIKDGQIVGYIKPLFRDMDVYDPAQDRHKSVLRKAYEGVVGGVAKLLENRPRDEVATRATVSGRLDKPRTSTVETIVRLIQNAFFQAILPGFDREVERLRRA